MSDSERKLAAIMFTDMVGYTALARTRGRIARVHKCVYVFLSAQSAEQRVEPFQRSLLHQTETGTLLISLNP